MATTPNISGKELIRFELQNEKKLSKVFREAIEKTKDLRAAFTLILRSQFKFQRQIFQLKGKGKFEPLSEKYAAYKRKVNQTEFPILQFTGRLSRSLTFSGGENYANAQPKYLEYGTYVPYGRFLQRGTKRMPARPFLFVDDQRLKAWVSILLAHVHKPFSQGIDSLGTE